MEIAVIGTGQLGSRHLQSLVAQTAGHSLHAVEPSATAQELARERLGPAANRVRFHPGIATLPAALDVVVVATGASVRRRVLTELLQGCRVRFLILEKILFQSVADCLWSRDFIAQAGATTWVNFPRRLQPVYRDLQAILRSDEALEIGVTGSRWGLATSAIHFLDLVLYLSRASEMRINPLDLQTFPSPRHQGCVEATGRITGETSSGVSFSLTAWATGDAPVKVAVDSAEHRWVVTERDNEALTLHAARDTGWTWVPATSALFYQSQLTGLLVGELAATGSCGLATLDEALRSHLPFLRSWNRHFAPTADADLTACSVT